YFKYNELKDYTLKNINLDINKGEKVLIAGPSGSGKSTLAHCINGLIPFSYYGEIEGELLINDIKPFKESIFRISEYVGTILQDQDGQFIGLSVGEDVAFVFENKCMPKKEMTAHVNDALESVGMKEKINETPHNLSGGQKQSVSIAGILASEAEILLFDEPLANLDPVSGKKAMELIDEIHKKTGKTVIIIEHRIEDVLEYDIDRVVLINNGEIISDSAPEKLLCDNILTANGIREPLYIEALKKAGVSLKYEDKIDKINNSGKYKKEINKFFGESYGKTYEKENNEEILKIENVYFRYYEDDPDILRDISFSVNKGEILAVIGNNGSGKSTLMKVITGIEKHKRGNIYYKNENINGWTIRKRAEKIGYVMQNPNHMINQSVIYDEVAFGLKNFGYRKEKIKENTEEALKICNLYQFRNWPVTALSYGQKKRLTIASILAMKPEIIILDEPTAGQDYKTYREFMDFIKTLKSTGCAVVIITHDMQLAMEYSDTVAVMSGGEIISKNNIFNVLSDFAVTERANLKETSLMKLAKICEVDDTEGFIKYFIKNHMSEEGENID
ncbi:MAG TPA: ABC transporter ATP-binding protein, partial [Tepiditoga sp.]|nr:ABC transporter ATP-binding protein [Tepiditoga sp.]